MRITECKGAGPTLGDDVGKRSDRQAARTLVQRLVTAATAAAVSTAAAAATTFATTTAEATAAAATTTPTEAAAATTACFLGPGLIDCQGAAAHVLAVERGNG